MKILHLSDFHIRSSIECQDGLRKAFFSIYLSGLCELVGKEEPDVIFITGDLVDRADLECLKHVLEVTNFISEEVGVDSGNIYWVNGNHDIHRDSGSVQISAFLSDRNQSKELLGKGESFELYGLLDKKMKLCYV